MNLMLVGIYFLQSGVVCKCNDSEAQVTKNCEDVNRKKIYIFMI